MGIPGLWDLVGRGELVPIAQLATECWQKHKRPYRIAVDEAGWRFNNLTDFQVQQIRAKEPRANPIEKAIFHRACRLLRLNIELIFVFDGPSRPWKRGKRGQGKVDWERTRLLKEVLKELGIPYHHAPGEAEAECARLQELGVVDAVWSDDGDTLMFGCTTLIQSYYEKGKGSSGKSNTHVRLIRMEDIRKQPGLQNMDKHGIALIALLSGGDYGPGIPQFGPRKALQALKSGLAESFKKDRFIEAHMQDWKLQVQFFVGGKGLDLPSDFPVRRVITHYLRPVVADTIKLLELADRWTSSRIDETTLRILLRTKFNIQTKSYIKHVIPILMTKRLQSSNRESSVALQSANLQLVKPRGKQATTEIPSYERKIKYSPQPFTKLDLSMAPGGETGEDWEPGSDFRQQTDCEMLEVLLRYAAPQVFDNSNPMTAPQKPAASTSRKRKATEDASETKSTKKPRQSNPKSTSTREPAIPAVPEKNVISPMPRARCSSPLLTFIPPPPLIVFDND